jgi:hypothetical protein
VARVDKYEPTTGGHRAVLGFTPAAEDLEAIIPVGLDANGRVQRLADSNTGVVGVLVPLTRPMNQGDVVDVGQDMELVECTGFTAGTRYYVGADGVVDTTATDSTSIGWTVEADRLVVRLGR